MSRAALPEPPEAGFTLVETLVALFVFAIVAGASTLIFGQTVEAGQVVEAASQEVQALQRTRAALRADLSQMVVRPSRDMRGDPRPVIRGGAGTDILFAFVRRGPEAVVEGQPAMQYVEWSLEGGALQRRAAPFVDGAELGEAAVLLPGVKTATSEFHIADGWSDRPEGPAPDVYPDAVSLTLESARFGRTEQSFLTGLSR